MLSQLQLEYKCWPTALDGLNGTKNTMADIQIPWYAKKIEDVPVLTVESVRSRPARPQ